MVGCPATGRAGAVGIHADSHPLLTVDKPRPVGCASGRSRPLPPPPGCLCARLGSKEHRDGNGKGVVARPGHGYIRMPAARFANTRPRVLLFCQPGIKPRTYFVRGGRWIFATTFFLSSLFFPRSRNFYIRFRYRGGIVFYTSLENWKKECPFSSTSKRRRRRRRRKHFFIFLSSSSDLKISSPEKRPSQVEDVSGYPRRSLPLLFRRG